MVYYGCISVENLINNNMLSPCCFRWQHTTLNFFLLLMFVILIPHSFIYLFSRQRLLKLVFTAVKYGLLQTTSHNTI